MLLQPELQQKSRAFIEADIVDPALIIETFFRIFKVIKIKEGRTPLSSHRFTSYDPIITVADEQVRFEAFSNDITHYVRMNLAKTAFKNIHAWAEGQTNIDFTPDFIKNLRDSDPKSLKAIVIDQGGIQVQTSTASLLRKKVEMPENWKIALDNLRKFMQPENESVKINDPVAFIKKTPFGPFVHAFGKMTTAWAQQEGWIFARIALRHELGDITIGETNDITQRFDGRLNPKYAAIRDSNTLRLLKSYLLVVKQLHEDVWEVRGGGRTHIVHKQGGSYSCDCPDTRFGPTTCKHIRAATRPRMKAIKNNPDSWNIITQANQSVDCNTVTFDGAKFTCSCKEFKSTNICDHVIEVLRAEEDFQFKELLEDLT